VCEGDLWYFPPGIPHSIQGLDGDVDGCEFLLVFDDGNFSEDSTFLLTDWLAHTPRDVVAKNFRTSEDKLKGLPAKELYIFPAPKPDALSEDQISGAGPVPKTFSHRLLRQAPNQMAGGTVRIADSTIFAASKNDRRSAGRAGTRRAARTALASERGRVAVLHRRRRPNDGIRLGKQGAHL
jgi:oxalate decarboxylase